MLDLHKDGKCHLYLLQLLHFLLVYHINSTELTGVVSGGMVVRVMTTLTQKGQAAYADAGSVATEVISGTLKSSISSSRNQNRCEL